MNTTPRIIASQPWKTLAVPAVCCHPHIAQPTVTPSSASRPTITNAVFMRGERSLSDSRSGFDANLRAAAGKLVFGIFASLAEFERDLISERTRAGLASARA